jgi:HPt (histidine-containing phosphotransfer) domain-containing protein
MEAVLIDFNKIKEFLGDDKEMFFSFYVLFKEQAELDIKELDRHIGDANWQEVSGIAHKMKSFYGNIGSDTAFTLLAELEKVSKENPVAEEIKVLQKKYLDLHEKITEEIDKYLSD